MIKIFCLHPNISCLDEFGDYYHLPENILSEMSWDSIEPEYVIVTEHLYKDKDVFKKFKKLYNPDRIFIFHAGEAISPDLNIFDYAIVFDRNLKNDSRIVRIPPMIFYERSMLPECKKNNLTILQAQKRLESAGLKFCNFIYSNPFAHPMRDKLFYKLSEYKKVDSLGKHLNNTGVESSRRKNNWAILSIEMKENYKFSIAAENETYEGYVSEKLLTSFQAHSVPIYWGDPNVDSEFNSEAFINANQYSSMDEIIDIVKKIDEDDNLWIKMACAPWQTDEQIAENTIEYENYIKFWNRIISLPSKELICRPAGTFSSMYIYWFFRNFKPKNNFLRDVKNYVGRSWSKFKGTAKE